jgi:hypothetical protein
LHILSLKDRQIIRIIMISAMLLLQIIGIGTRMAVSASLAHGERQKKNTPVQILLRDAKIALDAGQFARAQCLWLKIQKLYPQQCKPAWLQTDKPIIPPGSANDRQHLLNLASQTAEPFIKARLESLVRANPLDSEARNALLLMAQRQGDKLAVLRHKSIFQPVPRPCNFSTLKIFLAVVLAVAIFWCLFSASPGSKTFEKPEGEPLWREIFSSAKDLIKKHSSHK